MIPWPIAVVTVWFLVLAVASAGTVWRMSQTAWQPWLVWPFLWCSLSTALVVGLAWLKPWARTVAIWGSLLMMLSNLGVALMAAITTSPEPTRSLSATGLAGLHLFVIRYLTRPHVKTWFEGPAGTLDTRL